MATTRYLAVLLTALLCLQQVYVVQGQQQLGSLDNAEDFDDFDAFNDAPVGGGSASAEVPKVDAHVAPEEAKPAELPQVNKPKEMQIGHDAHAVYYDEDEFEGMEELAIPVASTPNHDAHGRVPADGAAAAAAATPNQEPQRRHRDRKAFQWSDWTLELCYATFAIAYIVNYFIGCRKNLQIAQNFVKCYANYFLSNWSEVNRLREVSKSEYFLFGSGRTHCRGFEVNINLRKRQDLVSVLWEFISPAWDELVIDIPVDHLQPFIFCVAKQRRKTVFKNELKDLKLTSEVNTGTLSNLFACLTDQPDFYGKIMKPHVVRTLQSPCARNLEMVYVSDQYAGSKVCKRLLRLIVRLPSAPALQRELDPLMELLLYFLDHVATMKMPPAVASAARERRKVAKKQDDDSMRKSKHEERQAAAQALKAKREEEERARVAKMSDKERAKWELKQEKKKRKKQQKAKFQVVGR